MWSSNSFKSFSIEQSSLNERTSGNPKPPKAKQVFSDFGDGACGEPKFSQHIILDFTPDAEIDNDISQKKICDFWNLINNSPHIKHLMVKPERSEITKPPPTEPVKKQPEENAVSMAKTACSMLEIVEEKELITRAFEVKMCQSNCSLGSREYKETEEIRQKKRGKRVPIICRCTKICKPCPVKKPPGSPISKVKQLCAELQEWDDKHPKSMEPPGLPPVPRQSTMQRQVFDF